MTTNTNFLSTKDNLPHKQKRLLKLNSLFFLFLKEIIYFLIALTVCLDPSFICSTTKYIPSFRSFK